MQKWGSIGGAIAKNFGFFAIVHNYLWLCTVAQRFKKKSHVHPTLIILLISLLYFLFLFFHFISVHPSLIFSTLSFSSSFLFSKLSFFSKFSLKFFSFSSLIFFVSSQFFLCYVRASSFAVWVWLWWVIGITAMSWV